MSSSSSNNVLSFSAEKMIYQSVQRFAVINLNDLIRVLMENIDDSLFELSDKAKNDRDRNMYFEAMREIRLKRDAIKESFNEELEQHFSRLLNQNTTKKKIEVGSNELSLLDQDELEDSLAIDNMITKARPHFEDELLAISERFKAILSRKEISADQNPLDPKSICDSFHNASEALEFDIEVKLIFYKLFDKYVMSNLGHFYTELNEYFIKKGVLVNFKASEERANQTTQFMANRIRSNPNAQHEKEEITASLAQQSVEGDLQNIAAPEGSILSLLQQMVAPQNNPQPNIPMVDMNPGASPTEVSSSNQPPVVGLSPAAHNTAYISALTNLQNINTTATSVQTNADPQALKTELQQQLVTFKQDNNQHSSAMDNQVIDIVSMIFDFFFEDDSLPNPIKVLIGRLQIPILKVAIIDNSFFNSKKHPARKLLDSISKASLGWANDNNDEQLLIDKVEEIVESLLAEFEQDISVFETALDLFQQFITNEKNKSKKQLDSIINDEKAREETITLAQEKSQLFIKSLIDRHKLSFDIVDFLDGIWKSVIYHTLLTQGDNSAHWKNIKRITTTLVWTLIVKHNDEDKKKLFKTLPALLRAMSKGLDLIKIDTEGKNDVFQMLVKEHAKVVRLSNQNIVTRVDDKTVWPEKNTEDAFANFNKALREKDSIDFNLADLDNSLKENNEEDTVGEIHETETQDVIKNLDEFTTSIANGDIQIDEEIIMDSSLDIHQTNIETNNQQDDFLETAQALEIGTWIEFNEMGSEAIQGKLSWKSNVTGKFVFVNRHGVKVKKITSFGLAVEFRSGNAKLMESSSVFDRALHSLMSSIGR